MFPTNVLSRAGLVFLFWPRADIGIVKVVVTIKTSVKYLSEFFLILFSVLSINIACAVVVQRSVPTLAGASIFITLTERLPGMKTGHARQARRK